VGVIEIMTKTTTPTNINEIQNIKTSGITINQIFSDHWEDLQRAQEGTKQGRIDNFYFFLLTLNKNNGCGCRGGDQRR